MSKRFDAYEVAEQLLGYTQSAQIFYQNGVRVFVQFKLGPVGRDEFVYIVERMGDDNLHEAYSLIAAMRIAADLQKV